MTDAPAYFAGPPASYWQADKHTGHLVFMFCVRWTDLTMPQVYGRHHYRWLTAPPIDHLAKPHEINETVADMNRDLEALREALSIPPAMMFEHVARGGRLVRGAWTHYHIERQEPISVEEVP